MQVDATGLAEGLHYAEVTGTSSSEPELGPIFRRASLACIIDSPTSSEHPGLVSSQLQSLACLQLLPVSVRHKEAVAGACAAPVHVKHAALQGTQ